MAIICLLISHIGGTCKVLCRYPRSSDPGQAVAAEPRGDVRVDGDVAAHVAGPEPLDGVEEGDFGPGQRVHHG